MILSQKTLEKLRLLINEDTEYRSGPKLVKFFNDLGFHDSYGQGFPSRWIYTDECLKKINGTPQIDECIRTVFSPINFIGNVDKLDEYIDQFNKYLAFDKWLLVRDGAELYFKKLQKIEFDEKKSNTLSEYEFLKREFSEVSVSEIGLEGTLVMFLDERISEIKKSFAAEAPLAVIMLAGSALEGILLGLAYNNPKMFNSSRLSPKDREGKVKRFHDWSLAAFIDVALDLRLINVDTHKFSHALRDFRNYIHPFEQMASGFSPRMHTAKICLQVLKAAIYEIHENIEKIHA